MEVNNYLSYYLYSSYCTNLQYDEFTRRYSFVIEAISDEVIDNYKAKIYSVVGRNLSTEQIRTRINNILRAPNNPVYRKTKVEPDTLFQDVLAGETIRITSPGTNVDLVKYNENNWMVLDSDCPEYHVGDYIEMNATDNLHDWLDSCEKTFIYSGMYHDTIDKIYLKDLYTRNVSSSIASLYERINESHSVDRITYEWRSIIEYAGDLGLGSYIVRRLLDSITK